MALSSELEALISELPEGAEGDNTEVATAEVVKEDTKEEQVEEVSESENDGDGSEREDKDTEDEAEDDSKTDDDEGYVIDDGEEDKVEDVSVSTQENKTATKLTPEDSYILDNLSPITVRGMVGDKEVTLEVLAPEQLPAGFNFADQREQAIAQKQFGMLEQRALQLQNDFRTQQSSKAANDFKIAEDNADRTDIGELQRAGEIPKFKADVDSKAFDADPAAQLIQSVLDFKEKENVRFLENFQAGKTPYRHIGFEEAYYKYQRSHPAETRSEAERKEDSERKAVARRTTKTTGTESKGAKQDNTRITSTRDMFSYIDNLNLN